MLLQEEIERQAEAPFGEPAGAVMASGTTVRKQPAARFARVEIFGPRLHPAQQRHNAKRQEGAPPQHHLHLAPQTTAFPHKAPLWQASLSK